MPTPEEVAKMISDSIKCDAVSVEGDGHHFFAKVLSSEFAGKPLVQRHRLVKKGLESRFASDELHALSLQVTMTKEEWEEKNPGVDFPG